MHTYNLVTVWRLPSPAPVIWRILSRAWEWPRWWPFVERVEVLEPGDDRGLGARHRHHWKTCLPYRLRFELTVIRIDPLIRVDTRVSGDLVGIGRCRLRSRGDTTVIRYDWHVHTTRGWMNRLAPVARPVFLWNHQRVMAAGEAALRRLLSSAANRDWGGGVSRH